MRSSTAKAAALGALILALAAGLAPAAARQAGDGVRVRAVNANASYPEGPLWLDGRLYYTEYGGQTVMAWDGRRNRRVWRRDGCGPSGLVETAKGTLLVTCYDSNTLAEITLQGETLRTIRRASNGAGFLGPNDFARDAQGGIYFSASGVYDADAPVQGTVQYISPTGAIRRVAGAIHYSNGLALAPDGKRLYVAEMLENRVLRYDVGANGRLTNRKVFVSLGRLAPVRHRGPLDGPDGLKTDARGRLYVTQNGTGRVLITSARGKLLRTVKVGARHVTNVALSPDAKTLAITSVVDPNEAPYPGKVYVATLP